MAADALLIDRTLPAGGLAVAEHLLVEADLATTWAALQDLDLVRVHTPLLDAAMWVRGLPARLRGTPEQPVPSLRVGGEGGAGLPGWVPLGSTPEREVAFGAVGRFWQPDIVWRDVAVEDFADFAEPGWGKLVAAFVLHQHGPGRTLVTYECRTVTFDLASQRSFARYWRLVRPFVAHILRAALRSWRDDAEARTRALDAPRPL